MKKLFLSLIALSLAAATAVFADSPLQLSLTPEIALRPRSETIKGLTIGVWGENPQSALALGIIQGAPGESSGVSLAVLLNYANRYKGIQWAAINLTAREFTGWQSGFLNYTDGRMTGLQTGTINYAGRLTGVQLGFLNYASRVEGGLQVGMINIIPQNEFLFGLPKELSPAMVFVNWKF